MTWVRLDDSAPDHEKHRRAGPEASWLWVRGLSYSNRYHTDGRLGKDIFDAVVGGVWTAKKAQFLAKKLCDVRLWHDHGDHFAINSYEEYQGEATREEEDIRKAYEAQRKRDQRAAKKARLSNIVPDNVPDISTDDVRDNYGTVPRAPAPWGAHAARGGARDPAPSRPVPSNPR